MLGPGAADVPLKLKQTAGQRRIQAQGDIVEHQLPFDLHLQLAPVFFEYPNVGHAVDRQGEIDSSPTGLRRLTRSTRVSFGPGVLAALPRRPSFG